MRSKKRGQFLIIAAVLILLVMISTIVFLYSNLPTFSFSAQNFLPIINSVQKSIQSVYAASASYYSSILNVTGNYTYARIQASQLATLGFNRLLTLYFTYGLTLSASKPKLIAYWYAPYSYTIAKGSVSYNLTQLGLSGLTINATQELGAQIVCPPRCLSSQQAIVYVFSETGPITSLSPQNFFFEVFSNTLSRWIKQPVTSVANYGNGTYSLQIPSGVSAKAFVLGIIDNRGILVYLTSYSKVNYAITWPPSISPSVPIMFEIFNNGTVSMLGENILSSTNYPIPPVPVKDLIVNETVKGGKSYQVPFQVEDWASGYTVPLGLSGNLTLFSNFQMIVTEVNTSVTSVTVYWKGLDSQNQTPYAIPKSFVNKYRFAQDSISKNIINNGLLIFNIQNSGVQISVTDENGRNLGVIYYVRADNVVSFSGGGFTFTIVNGVVRDILQVEPENSAGFGSAYSAYFQVVTLIPWKSNLTQVFVRAFFVATTQTRTVNDLMFVQLKPSFGNIQIFIDNGNSNSNNYLDSYSSNYGDYYNQQSSNAHFWGMFCSYNGNSQNPDPTKCNRLSIGFLMTQNNLQSLYNFPSIQNQPYAGVFAGQSCKPLSPCIEIDPYLANVKNNNQLQFSTAYTIAWTGELWFGSSSLNPYVLRYLVGTNSITITASAS